MPTISNGRTTQLSNLYLVRRMLLIGTAVAMVGVSSAANADPLNPNAFASLGTLNLNAGSITINTDTMQITGAANFTGVSYPQSGGSNIAVFCFNNINLGTNLSVTITGSHPLAPVVPRRM